MFICTENSNNIEVVRIDGTLQKPLLSINNGIKSPRCITVRQTDDGHMFMTGSRSFHIQVRSVMPLAMHDYDNIESKIRKEKHHTMFSFSFVHLNSIFSANAESFLNC